MPPPPPTSRFPRWMVLAFYPLAAFAMTAFFVFLGFPYDRLALRLGEQAERSMRVRLSVGELSPHIGLAGPGLAARDVLAGREGGRTFAVEELVVRPAWSTAWFRGTPAVHVDFSSEIGSGSGVVTLGERRGMNGTLESVRLEYLPIEMPEALEIDGTLDATVDLHGAGVEAGGGLVGTVDFDVREGSVSTQALPVSLPFERLHGQLLFGGDAFLTVSDVELEGPMIAGRIEGQVGHGSGAARQPLSIGVSYEVRDPGLASLLGSVGTPGADGRSHFSVTGTLAQPVVR